jgi:3-oxo-5alpha-steroid 4-dehydrogenase
MVNQADGRGWLLIDNSLVKLAWKQIWPTKVLPFQWQLGALNMLFGKQKYRDQASLCEGLGFDPGVLEETLGEVEKCAEMGVQDRFGKPVGDLRKLEFPLHVIDVSLAARLLPCTVLTMGGLRVHEATGEVIGQENVPVAGLYAAGRNAVGIPSHLYMSGLSIADCVFSGLRAAGHMANQEQGV